MSNRYVQMAVWAAILGFIVLYASRFAGAAARRIPA